MSGTKPDDPTVALADLRRRLVSTFVAFCCVPVLLAALALVTWHNQSPARWVLLAFAIVTAAAVPVLFYGLRKRLSQIARTPPSAQILALLHKLLFWLPVAFTTPIASVGILAANENFELPIPLVIVIFCAATATGLVSYVRIMTLTGYLQDAPRS